MFVFFVKLLVLLLFCFYFIEWRLSSTTKQNKFCVSRSEIKSYLPPRFYFNENEKKHVNSGGQGCLEDIVKYANLFRAGSDGYVGTADDRLTLEEQIDVVYELLRSEFPGGFWANSPWHFNHNAGVSGHFKLLYGDMYEYIALYGHRVGAGGGYSGCYKFDVYDFVLEGIMFTQFVGNMTRSVFTPHVDFIKKGENKKFSQYEKVAEFVAFMPNNTQKIYAAHPTEGVMMMEYARGSIVTSMYSAIVMPFFFHSFDLRSTWLSIRHYAESILRNSFSYFSKFDTKNDSLLKNSSNNEDETTTKYDAAYDDEL